MTKCPYCQKALPPTKSSNNPTTITLEVPYAPLASLNHAFAIARNTAMMCAEPTAKGQYEHLRKTVEALTPDIASYFNEGNWTELLFKLSEGMTISMSVEKTVHWNPQYIIVVTAPNDFSWPHSSFKTPNQFFSEAFDDKKTAMSVLTELQKINQRLAPIQA